MKFDTKLAVVVRDDLPTWQKLNMTAFLVSGIAAKKPEIIGEDYEDGSGNLYLPMFRQPTMVFGASADQIRRAYDRAMQNGVQISLFTEDLFSTGHDEANRAAVKAVPREALNVVGMAFHAPKKVADKILDGLSLHK
ncbi:MAG: DUF2000 domain-containing protein [Anaerolineae bacterium]|nr:DUF2000 domain-containing protein [Anaerolineae bacterium]